MERQKLALGERQYGLEERKFGLLKWTYRIDIVAKLLLPAGVLALAFVTYQSNDLAAKNRLQFDRDVRESEVVLKERELGLRQVDSNRAQETRISAFIQQNYALIISRDTDAEAKAIKLARAVLSEEALVRDAISKIQALRSQPAIIQVATTPVASANAFLDAGKAALRRGEMPLALQHFSNAIALDQNNASAWNSKAYAEMRLGDNQSAFASISTAVRLNPADQLVRRNIVLNVTKILCSQQRGEEAVSYLNTMASVVTGVGEAARNDGELTSRCHFTWS